MADYPKFLDPRSAEALERSRNRVIDGHTHEGTVHPRPEPYWLGAEFVAETIAGARDHVPWGRGQLREAHGCCWRCGVEYAACLCHGHTHGRGAE